ncbi:MAG: serine protease [Bdellovibrio sp. ArHS]|uniref:S8 family serine peptidase n=1 Tax=Bdellovibrio sp. ArHS TaxID=1569284 RepID=UPI0005829A5E|nr:S8 family serine peptidase [Bdellovibrio sp. ArHS]KHD88431.1 MAG: serine protease [Bdellovibrio sp. ArHS]
MKRILGALFIPFSLLSFAAYAQNDPKVVPGEYLIKFKASSGGPTIAQTKLLGKASLKAAFPGLDIMQVTMKSGPDEKASFEALKNDPDVEYIEPNYILDKAEVALNGSVERLTYEQFANSSPASTDPAVYAQSNAATGVANAWPLLSSLSAQNGKVIVAVVDTGLDRYHDVFKPLANGGTGALWVNPVEAAGQPGVDDDQNGYVDDVNGWNFITNTNNFMDDDDHGTHVAGIVVGTGQNIFARPLQESKISIMPLKFLGATGSGSTSNAIRAIYYAVNNGARVINNSWGGGSYSRSLHDAITYAYERRVLVVSAAGNYGSNNDASPMYPANYDVPSNISIASSSRYDDLSSFSNYGASTVHVASPGEYIESTVPGNTTMPMNGTSMAAPFVAGMAALAFREAPSLSGYQMKQLILGTASAKSFLNNLVYSSARIDAYEMIRTSQQMVATASTQPDYKPYYLTEQASTSGSGAAGGGCGLVKAVTHNGPGSGQGGGAGAIAVVIGLLMAPLVVWQVLRSRDPKRRRRYERFKMNSEIRVTVGDRELIGAVNTISEGGLSFNADAALEKGGIVTMRIQSPDGHEVIEVQGQVVWSEQNQAYGVQFANARQGTLAMIRDWTSGLIKSS